MKRFLALLLIFTLPAAAQDYEREKRWAAEVVPNLVVGDAVRISAAGRTFLGIYTEVKNAKSAILLVHGAGVHPDHSVIGVLRVSLSDMGYSTLSIQMPVLRSDAANDEYAPLFAEAAARIQAGADWLARKGYARPVLLSHSMGSRMSNAYFERMHDAPFAAWVCMGLSGSYGRMVNVEVPVLDLYGENDLPGVRAAAWRRGVTVDGIPGSAQQMIPGADHFYTGREKALAAEILRFLSKLE
ncbi:MAG TPA: DUF3530 family protein [Burkholderiales bacterium]|nr:DUF3530 family protein [Burkholderiales bacterium]